MVETQKANRTQIGIFGRCNVGKSSLLNALTSQDLAVVSPIKGTTTDPVRKTIELLPLGPIVLVDTPGLDDVSLIGEQRVEKTKEVLRNTHIALLVLAGANEFSLEERELLEQLETHQVPFLIVQNKIDETDNRHPKADVFVSSVTGEGLENLKEELGKLQPKISRPSLLSGVVNEQQLILLVTPIDAGAPKGRLILPQQQTIRGILDNHSTAMVTQPEEIPSILSKLKSPPDLVITDSQIFGQVSDLLPNEIPLTSFSILFARFNGVLEEALKGIETLELLQNDDKILISEGCSHHRQCEDLGTVKIPRWILEETKKDLKFAFTSGGSFPENLNGIQLVVHCGGCMLNDKEINYRIREAKRQGVPITNYGILISKLQGTLHRSIQIFKKDVTYGE